MATPRALARRFLRPLLHLFQAQVTPASIIRVSGTLLEVDPQATAQYLDTTATGGVVWPSAHVLCRHLAATKSIRDRITGGRVLEIGSGLGLVGMAAAVL